MRKKGKYFYGVINSNIEKTFDLGSVVSFEDVYPHRSPLQVMDDGEDSAHAYTVCFRDIAAVVRDAEIVDYSHIPRENLARLLVGHQQLIEKVMTGHTIIPMKLGTFAESDREVEQILDSGYRTIKDIFERVQDAIEIDVVTTLEDFNAFLQEISEEQEIRTLKQTLMSKKNSVTVDDQLRLGVLIKKYSDRIKADYAEQIQTALSEVSEGFRAHDLMDDKMVLNTAFLLSRSRQTDFERRIEEINDGFEEKLNFRCVGPLPPYSFYTLEISKPQFEQIDWARKRLGLDCDFVTAEDIKKAHRRSALTCHPDKNPGAPNIEKKFDDMAKAYKILLDYYRASHQVQDGRGCRLSKEAFEKDAVLVTTAG
jgi:hypothetical protein